MDKQTEKSLRKEFEGVLNARKKIYSEPEEMISSLIEMARNAPPYEGVKNHIELRWNKHSEKFEFYSNVVEANSSELRFCTKETLETVEAFLYNSTVSMQKHEDENTCALLIYLD